MPIELKHTYSLERLEGSRRSTQTVTPSGTFSINVRRQDYRYYLDLDGVMTFRQQDFDFIFQADDEAEFFLSCDFKGVTWKGYFTKVDCDIHADKRYIDVEPITDDEYRKIEPWMGVDLNILPPFAGQKADTEVEGIRTYRKERVTVTIDEPSTFEGWEGWSVNDRSTTSALNRGTLSYYLENGRQFALNMGAFYRAHLNYLMTIDYAGFTTREVEGRDGHVAFLRQVLSIRGTVPNMYTLIAVHNNFDKNQEWESATLVYEREVWDSEGKPPSGRIWNYSDGLYDAVIEGISEQAYYDDNSFSIYKIKPTNNSMPEISFRAAFPKGWVYSASEDAWYRRPFGMGSETPNTFSYSNHIITGHLSGNRFWYTLLGNKEEKDGGYQSSQYLFRNLNYADSLHQYEPPPVSDWVHSNAIDMYEGEYGYMTVKGRYHRIESLLKKFLAHIDIEGGDLFELSSKFFTDSHCPLPQLSGINEWRDALMGHFSDIKRPEATEKANKEEMSFTDFLNNLCALTNTSWAVVNGKFYVEHAFFFQNAFSYSEIEDTEGFINPLSIYNLSKDKTFMNLSNQYMYDRPNMQKFEEFIMAGGAEPQHHNARITYDSPIANHEPGQNTREVTIDKLATDYDWIISESPDNGLGVLKAILTDVEGEGSEGTASGTLVYLELPRESSITFDFTKNGVTQQRTISRADKNIGEALSILRVVFNGEMPFDTLKIVSTGYNANTNNCQISFQHTDNVSIFPWYSPYEEEDSIVTPVSSTNGAFAIAGEPYIYEWGEDPAEFSLYKYDIPVNLDDNFLYNINQNFSLEDILRRYHWYGRSFKRGEINGELTNQLVTRPYIIQNIGFPYRQIINPYNKVITELGIGIIREASQNQMTGFVEMSVGFQEGESPSTEVPQFDRPDGGKERIEGIFFYRHVQEEPSSQWIINHGLDTDAIMRPVVYIRHDEGMQEIGYQSVQYRGSNVLSISFSTPVQGEVYLLSLFKYNDEDDDDDTEYLFEQEEPALEWNIPHNLDTDALLHSVLWDNNTEVRYNNFFITDKDNVQITFTVPTKGRVYIVPSPTPAIQSALSEDDDDDDEGGEVIISRTGYPLKPFVLHTHNSVLQELGYNSNILEESLIRLGFSKDIIATIILKQYD